MRLEDWKQFWEAYPRKQAEDNARAAWFQLQPSPELVKEILQALERQKRSAQWRQGVRYILTPDKWLAGGHWKDEMPEHFDRKSKVDELWEQARQKKGGGS